jgi:peptide-methionine (R)-S-oxide reductase
MTIAMRETVMKRRKFLSSSIASVALSVFGSTTVAAAVAMGKETISLMQSRWRNFLADSAKIASDPTPLTRELDSWREELPRDAFEVLFEEDTERPFSSTLNDEKRPGLFVCRACALPLFSAEMKYDSGTGWPSFFTSIPDHLETKTDYKLIWPRTEYHCVKCGGHQGHVFEDGPQPTGNRWCNNGLALRFIPADSA